jgi:hypothetical protein
MTDYAQHGMRHELPGGRIEARLLYGACYLVFLARAVIRRVPPWRRQPAFGDSVRRESIFSEAATVAGVIVSASFMGL